MGLTAKVLYFFFQLESRSIHHPLLQNSNQFPHLQGGPPASVVDQIRVVIGHTDPAQNRAFGPGKLQKVGRGNFSFPDHPFRDLGPDRFGKFGEQQILEDTPGAVHGWGVFLVANLEDSVSGGAQLSGISRREPQGGIQHDPVFVPLEDALAISELAGSVGDFPNFQAVEEAHGLDEFVNRVAVGSGVAVDRAAHPARNACHGVQTLETGRDRRVHQVLKYGAGRDAHYGSIDFDAIRRVAQDDARESAVIGDKVAAAADQSILIIF